MKKGNGNKVNNPLTGYPISVATRMESVFDHMGPKSYPTGGETIPANDVGMSSLEWVETAQYSMSGNYTVVVLYGVGLFLNVASVKIAWYNASDGSQVTNGTDLSGEHVRMLVKGIA